MHSWTSNEDKGTMMSAEHMYCCYARNTESDIERGTQGVLLSAEHRECCARNTGTADESGTYGAALT